MKKAKEAPLKPLLEALQGLRCDGRTKSQAFNFLKMDLSQLDSDAAFRKAFAGLLAVEQLLSPLHPHYARCLDGMRKSLVAYQKAHFDMTPTEWRKVIEEMWRNCCGIFEKHCPPQDWEKVGQWTENVFRELLK